MRAIKVMTGVWLSSGLVLALLYYGTDTAFHPEKWGNATLGYAAIILPPLLIFLVGIPIIPILWTAAFFIWLTKPSKPDFTPREIASREKPVVTHDAGHRWLG
jgi:hypothetical protein